MTSTRRTGLDVRTTRLLAVGMLASGLLAYAFYVLATRTLGDEGGAALAVLWAYWNMASAFLSFPLQHWIDRTCTADGHGGTVRSSLPRLGALIAGLAVSGAALAYVARVDLFGTTSATYPLALGAVTAGVGLSGIVRGLLASHGRHVSVVAEQVGENAVRATLAATIIALGASTELFAWALAAGAIVGPLVVRGLRFEGPAPEAGGSPFAFLRDIAGASLLSQLVLTSSPIVLQLLGAAPGVVTTTFSALALGRMPYLVSLGVVTQVTSLLTGWHVAGERHRLARARVLVAVTAVGAAALVAPLAAWEGNEVLRIVYDLETQLTATSLAAIAIGTVLAIGNLVLGLVLVARGAGRPVVRSWLLGIAGFALVATVAPVDALADRVLLGFASAEVLTLAALWAGDVAVARLAEG